MPRAIRRCSVLTGLALCAVLAGGVGAAQANDNTLRGTLNHYTPKIVKDEKAVHNGLLGYPKGKIKPLIRALNREVADLHKLVSRLNHERASSAKGRTAKKDLVQGLTLIAKYYATLRTDVKAANGRPVSKAKVNAALAIDHKGRKKFLKGFNLLK